MTEALLQHKVLGSGKTQDCPLCGMAQEVHFPALKKVNPTDTFMAKIEDKGYSFCNCKNIFFTDWSNMNQGTYDKAYAEKYKGKELQESITKYAKEFMPMFKDCEDIFVEAGCAYPYVMDEAKRSGFITFGIDIILHSDFEGHNTIVGDIEGDAFDSCPRADVIWASHIVEHLKHPLNFVYHVYDRLKDGGYLFVAMPDPWFIPWERPELWSHWVIEEHHILWDMDSFIDECLAMGFELIRSNRNVGYKYGNLSGDYQIILRKI